MSQSGKVVPPTLKATRPFPLRARRCPRRHNPQHLPALAKLPPVLIGMEACGVAHYWARRFREHGPEVKLMAPQFVKPYGAT